LAIDERPLKRIHSFHKYGIRIAEVITHSGLPYQINVGRKVVAIMMSDGFNKGTDFPSPQQVTDISAGQLELALIAEFSIGNTALGRCAS
jgi:hypothetical protein